MFSIDSLSAFRIVLMASSSSSNVVFMGARDTVRVLNPSTQVHMWTLVYTELREEEALSKPWLAAYPKNVARPPAANKPV
jgi:hypothetical protein